MGLTSRCFESCFCIYPGASVWLVYYLPTFNNTSLPDGDKYSRSRGLYGSHFLYSPTNIAPEKMASYHDFSELLLMEEFLHQLIVSLSYFFRVLYIPLSSIHSRNPAPPAQDSCMVVKSIAGDWGKSGACPPTRVLLWGGQTQCIGRGC